MPNGEPFAVAADPRTRRTDLHLTIVQRQGSVEHYFHFLLGFFAPLVHALATRWPDREFCRVLVRSCGPLDPIVRELGDRRIEILSKETHARAIATDDATLEFDEIRGFDRASRYAPAIFRKVRKILRGRPDVEAERRALPPEWTSAALRILLIRRAPPDPFYVSDAAEAGGAGSLRRSIANHDALHRALSERFGGVLDVATEGMSLARQIALFSSANVIVAQHGAALANLLWANAGALVVEYFPRPFEDATPELLRVKLDYFAKLAQCLELHHHRIWQDGMHGDADIAATCAVIARHRAARSRVRGLAGRALFRAYQCRRAGKRVVRQAMRLLPLAEPRRSRAEIGLVRTSITKS